MSLLITETPEGLSLEASIAGPGSRAMAALLDLVLFIFLLYVLLILCAIIPGIGESLMIWISMGFGLALMFYQPVCAIFMKGKTPGKTLAGLVVVDEAGFPASLFQHTVRGLFWPLELIPFPLPLGVMLMAGSAQHQRLGDRVAGTLVLREAAGELPVDPYVNVLWTQLRRRRLALVPAHRSRFDERDFLFLRNLIGRTDVDGPVYDALIREALAHYLKVLDLTLATRPKPKEARAVLSELYVFLRHER